jgi:hypothetical protein
MRVCYWEGSRWRREGGVGVSITVFEHMYVPTVNIAGVEAVDEELLLTEYIG